VKIKKVKDVEDFKKGDEVLVIHESKFPSMRFMFHGKFLDINRGIKVKGADKKGEGWIRFTDIIQLPLTTFLGDEKRIKHIVKILRKLEDPKHPREKGPKGYHLSITKKGWTAYKIS
jgi:hypothetical protein